MVGYWPTISLTDNRYLGLDSLEGELDMDSTSNEGSRHVNHPIMTQGGSDIK